MVNKIIGYLQDHKITKKVLLLFLIISTVFSVLSMSITAVNAVTHSRVVIAPMLDPNTNSVVVEVVEEEKSWKVGDKWNDQPNGSSDYCGTASAGNACAYLNFPGYKYDNETGITSKDEALATNVGSVMENSFATFFNLVEKNKKTSQSIKMEELKGFLNLGDNDDGSVKSGSFVISGLTVKFQPLKNATFNGSVVKEAKTPSKYTVESGVNKGTTINNYAIITVTGANVSDYAVVQWSVPKGYSNGQYAEEVGVSDAWKDNGDSWVNTKYISMYGIAKYAINAYSKGYVLGDKAYEAIYGKDSNWATSALGWFFTVILKGLYSALDIDDVVELVFSRGGRAVSYYYGIMPYRWMDVAKILYWLALVVSGFMLFYQIYLLIAKRSMADISPSVRMDMRESFLNIGIVIFLQIIYVPLFSLLCQTNALIVGLFSSLVQSGATTFNLGYHGFGLILISLVSLGLTVSMNIKYIIRALTVTLAYATGPIFITSIAMDRRRQLFTIWIKELVSTIFLQAFNAGILAFLFMVTTGQRGLMRLIMLYSFIPLNKWYRESLWGVRNGAMSAAEDTERRANLGGKTKGALMGAATAGLAFDQAAGTNMFGKGIPPMKQIGDKNGQKADPAAEKNSLKQIGTSKNPNIPGNQNPQQTKDGGSKPKQSFSSSHPKTAFAIRKGGAMVASGALGAAGLPGGPLLGRAVGARMASPFARMQEAYSKGYAGIQDGYVHMNDKGEIDGFANSKKELKDRYGDTGTITKGQYAYVDPNKVDEDSWKALKQTGVDKNAEGDQKFLTDPNNGMKVVAATSASPLMDINKAAKAAQGDIERFRNAGYSGMKEQGWYKPGEDDPKNGTFISNEDYEKLSDEEKALYSRAYKSDLDSSFIKNGELTEKGLALEEGINERDMDPGSVMLMEGDKASIVSLGEENEGQNVPNANTISGNILAEQRKDAANEARDLRNAGYAGKSEGFLERYNPETEKYETFDKNQFDKLSDAEKDQMKADGWVPMTKKDVDPTLASDEKSMAAIQHAMNDNNDYNGARVVENPDRTMAVIQPARDDFTSKNLDLNNIAQKELAKADNDAKTNGFGERTKGAINDKGEFKSNAELAKMPADKRAQYNHPVVKSEIADGLTSPESLGLIKRAIDHGGVNGASAVTGTRILEGKDGKMSILQDSDRFGHTADFKLGNMIKNQENKEAAERANGFVPEATQYGMMKKNADGTYDFKSKSELAKMPDTEKSAYTIPGIQRQVQNSIANNASAMKTLTNAAATGTVIAGAGKIAKDAAGNTLLTQRLDAGDISRTNVMPEAIKSATSKMNAMGYNTASPVQNGFMRVKNGASGSGVEFKTEAEYNKLSDAEKKNYTPATSIPLSSDVAQNASTLRRGLAAANAENTANGKQNENAYLVRGSNGQASIVQAAGAEAIDARKALENRSSFEQAQNAMGYKGSAQVQQGYMKADSNGNISYKTQDEYNKMSPSERADYVEATSRPLNENAFGNSGMLRRSIESSNAENKENGREENNAYLMTGANGEQRIIQAANAQQFNAAKAYRAQDAEEKKQDAMGYKAGTIETGKVNAFGDFKSDADLSQMSPAQAAAYTQAASRAQISDSMSKSDYQMAAIKAGLDDDRVPGARLVTSDDGKNYVVQTGNTGAAPALPDLKKTADAYSAAVGEDRMQSMKEDYRQSRIAQMQDAGFDTSKSSEPVYMKPSANNDGSASFVSQSEYAAMTPAEQANYRQAQAAPLDSSKIGSAADLQSGLAVRNAENDAAGNSGNNAYLATGSDGTMHLIRPFDADNNVASINAAKVSEDTAKENASLARMGFDTSEPAQVGFMKPTGNGAGAEYKTAAEYNAMSDAEKADYSPVQMRPVDSSKVSDTGALQQSMDNQNALNDITGRGNENSYYTAMPDGSMAILQPIGENGRADAVNPIQSVEAENLRQADFNNSGLDGSAPVQVGYMKPDANGTGVADFKTPAEYNAMSGEEKEGYIEATSIPVNTGMVGDMNALQNSLAAQNAENTASGNESGNAYLSAGADGNVNLIQPVTDNSQAKALDVGSMAAAQAEEDVSLRNKGYMTDAPIQTAFAENGNLGGDLRSSAEYGSMDPDEKTDYTAVSVRPLNDSGMADALQNRIDTANQNGMPGYDGVAIMTDANGNAAIVQPIGSEVFNAEAAYKAQMAAENASQYGYGGDVEYGKTNASGDFKTYSELAQMPEEQSAAYTKDVVRAPVSDSITASDDRMGAVVSAFDNNRFDGAEISDENGRLYVTKDNADGYAALPDLNEAVINNDIQTHSAGINTKAEPYQIGGSFDSGRSNDSDYHIGHNPSPVNFQTPDINLGGIAENVTGASTIPVMEGAAIAGTVAAAAGAIYNAHQAHGDHSDYQPVDVMSQTDYTSGSSYVPAAQATPEYTDAVSKGFASDTIISGAMNSEGTSFANAEQVAQMSDADRSAYASEATMRPIDESIASNPTSMRTLENAFNENPAYEGLSVGRDNEGNAYMIQRGSGEEAPNLNQVIADYNRATDNGYASDAVFSGSMSSDGTRFASSEQMAHMSDSDKAMYTEDISMRPISDSIRNDSEAMKTLERAVQDNPSLGIAIGHDGEGNAYTIQSGNTVSMPDLNQIIAAKNNGFVPETAQEGYVKYNSETGKYDMKDFKTAEELQKLPEAERSAYSGQATVQQIDPQYSSNSEVMSKLEKMAESGSGNFSLATASNGAAAVVQLKTSDMSAEMQNVNVKELARKVLDARGYSGDADGKTMYASYGDDNRVNKVISPAEYSRLPDEDKKAYTKGNIHDAAEKYTADTDRLQKAMDTQQNSSSYVPASAFTTEARSTPAIFTPEGNDTADVNKAVTRSRVFDSGYDPDFGKSRTGYVLSDSHGNLTGSPLTTNQYQKLSEEEKKKYTEIQYRKLAEDILAMEDNSGSYFESALHSSGGGEDLKEIGTDGTYVYTKGSKKFPNVRKKYAEKGKNKR